MLCGGLVSSSVIILAKRNEVGSFALQQLDCHAPGADRIVTINML